MTQSRRHVEMDSASLDAPSLFASMPLPSGKTLFDAQGQRSFREAVEMRLACLHGVWGMRLLARDIISALGPAVESVLSVAAGKHVTMRRVKTVRITRCVREYGACTIARGNDGACCLAFSGHLFFAGNASNLIDVIAHELLHACFPNREKHGANFHAGMDLLNHALGLHITVYSEDSSIRQSEALYRYKVVCAACGNTFYYLRAGAIVRSPSLYRCAKCGKSAFEVYRLIRKDADTGTC